MATVGSLPDSVIVHILSYCSYPWLINSSEVCKRWHRLSNDPSLWRKFHVFKEHAENVTNDVMEKIIPCRNNFILSIDLTDCQGITDESLQRIAVHCPTLKSLNLRGCDLITDRGVLIMALSCSTLEKLVIPVKNVSEVGLSALVKHNLQLSKLYAYSTAVTQKTMSALASNCSQLEKLVVYEAPLEENEKSSADLLTNEMVRTLAKGCQLLKKLTLRYNQVVLSDAALFALAKKCRNLESLIVDYCDQEGGITDLGVCALAQMCKELKTLSLSNGDITDASLWFIAEHLHNIKDLSFEFSEISDFGLHVLLRKCNKLERLVIHNSDSLRGITDTTAYVIAKFSSDAFHSLGLGFTDLSDEGFKVICESTNLTSLSINGCGKLTFEGLRACFADLKSLWYFDISFTDIIMKDEQLLEIGESLPVLGSLDITDCFSISQNCIRSFREAFPLCKVIV